MATVTSKKVASPVLGSVDVSKMKKWNAAALEAAEDRTRAAYGYDENGTISFEEIIGHVYGASDNCNLRALINGHYARFYVIDDRYVLLNRGNNGYGVRCILDIKTGALYSWHSEMIDTSYTTDASKNFEDLIDQLTDGLPTQILARTKGNGYVVLFSGDEYTDANSDAEQGYPAYVDTMTIDYIRTTTISFRCLARMISGEATDSNSLLDTLEDKITVMDFTADQTLEVSSSIAAAFKAKGLIDMKTFAAKYKAPSPGYVMRSNDNSVEWHRSPYVVINVPGIDGSLLFGVDESAYFCCELEDRVNTVTEAFRSLIPKEVPTGSLRQGEWFMVPVSEKSVPRIEECDFLAGGEASDPAEQDEYSPLQEDESKPGEYSGIALPVEDETSARHIIFSGEEIRFKDGKLYAKAPTLRHARGEHADVTGVSNQWYTFVRNTAVRSVGEVNVD